VEVRKTETPVIVGVYTLNYAAMQTQLNHDLVRRNITSRSTHLTNNPAQHLYLPEESTGQEQGEHNKNAGVKSADHGLPPQSEKGLFFKNTRTGP
jgi:hypothetical protein